jgi:glutamyl/glutaminyl-tRNA synthetase
LVRERCEFIKDIPEFADYLFKKPDTFDESYKLKHWTDSTPSLIHDYLSELVSLQDFSTKSVHDFTMLYIENKGIKLKEIIHPLRLMITGKSSGAGMFETMEVLGKDECMNRIRYFIDNLL